MGECQYYYYYYFLFHWFSFHSTKLHFTKTLLLRSSAWTNTRTHRWAVGSGRKGSQGRREGSLWKQSRPTLLRPRPALSPTYHTSYHISGISQSLIFSSCEPIGLLTPLSCCLQRYLGIRYLRAVFPVCGWVRLENKVPLVLLVWCQGQFLIPFYKAFLLLMQQLVGY